MEIAFKGNVRDTSLVRILVSLNRNRKTGTLSLTTPTSTKKMFLDTGDAIFASSTYPDDRLGEMLLKADKITVEQYDRAVEILKTSKKRLGAILVDKGYLTPKDLFWGVKYQVREIIYSMFLIEEGQYEFVEGAIPSDEVITLRMSMGNLVYEGVRRIENWTRIRNEMPDTGSVLGLSGDPVSLFQHIELSRQDKEILSLIDGKRTIKEVIDRSLMGSFEVLKILYVFWSTGIVEERPALVPAGEEADIERPLALDEILQPLSQEEETFLKKVDSIYFRLDVIGAAELLEANEASDADTIRRNYYRLAKEFHPDRYFATADNTVKTKLTAIFDAIGKAYSFLQEERQRKGGVSPTEKAGEVADEAKAAEQFRKGVGELKKGNITEAIGSLKLAVTLVPRNAGYWNYLSLAYAKIPGRLREAEEALLTAIKVEPFNGDLYANLGLVYLKAGQKKRARSNFEKTLKFDPHNEKAQRGLEQTRE